MKIKYEIFYNETLFFLQKFLFLLHFGSCQNCMSSGDLVAEVNQKVCNRRVLSSGKTCTFEYITLFLSIHRPTLSIHWYIPQNFQTTFFMSFLFRRLFRIVIFSKFSMAAIVTSYFMKEFCNAGFAPEFSVSI